MSKLHYIEEGGMSNATFCSGFGIRFRGAGRGQRRARKVGRRWGSRKAVGEEVVGGDL